MLRIDGHDNAILGIAFVWQNGAQVPTLVYDAETIRENFESDGMTSEEAREFLEFNIEGASVGEQTPIVVWTQDEIVIDED